MWKQAINACKDLQPPGTLSAKRTPKEQSASLRFAQCIREQRREGLPGPRQRRAARQHVQDPVLATSPAAWPSSTPRCRSAATSWKRRRGASGEAEELGAGRGGRAGRGDLRRGRAVGCGAPDRGRPGAGGEHRDGGAGRALGDGLPGRDPDLPGAVGRLALPRDQPGPRRSTPSCPTAGTRSAAAACSTGWTTGRCCCCAARSRPTARCTWAMQGRDVRQLNRNLHGSADGAVVDRDASRPRRSRRSGRSSASKGVGVTGGSRIDDAVFLPEAVRIAKVTGQLGGSARPGAPVLQRHVRHAARAGGPRPVPAGRGQEGRPGADHAAGQHAGDGTGRAASDESPRPRLDRTAARPTRPSRPSSASTTRPRRAGSTRPRSRWTSPPRAWRAP